MASKTSPNHAQRLITKDGTTYGLVYIPAQAASSSSISKKPINLLFIHGYPSSSYDWRHQIETFSQLGYGIIVPDLLGYGDTDKPTSVADYAMPRIGGHVFEILEQLGVERVVAVAHDWGCGLLASMVRMERERFEGVVFVAVGYSPRGPVDIDQINAGTQFQIGYPLFGYWTLHIQDDAAGVIEKNAEAYLSLAYPDNPTRWITDLCPPGKVRAWTESGRVLPLPSWLNKEEHAIHVSILKEGGFTGPLNWYKQAVTGVTYEIEKNQTDEQQEIHKPLLYIGASRDYVCLEAMGKAGTEQWAKGGFEYVSIDAGHWAYLEKQKEFDEALGAWLKKTFDTEAKI